MAAVLLALFVGAAAAFLLALAGLPGRMDEFLLTNDSFCFAAAARGGENPVARSTARTDAVQADDALDSRRPAKHLLQKGFWNCWREWLWHAALGKVAAHLWHHSNHSTREGGSSDTRLNSTQQQWLHPTEMDPTIMRNDPSQQYLHPLCREHRILRTRLRYQRLFLPWNWYYRAEFRLEGVTLHSLADEVNFVPKEEARGRWPLFRSSDDANTARVDFVSTRAPWEELQRPPSHLPPTLEINVVDVSFQSWRRPVIAVQMHGITVNVVVQKGGLPPTPPMTPSDLRRAANGSALLLGAMPLSEALHLLPQPPEEEGLYPRIGFLNITDVMLRVYENKGRSLRPALAARVPDGVFAPVAELTRAHARQGIDMKHFQPMVQASMAKALQAHLLSEAADALRHSWTQAHRAQEQLRQFALEVEAQELYSELWIRTSLQVWQRTQESVLNGVVDASATFLRAVEDLLSEMKDLISKPRPPLAVVASHFWNQAVKDIQKHAHDVFNAENHVSGPLKSFAPKLSTVKHEGITSKPRPPLVVVASHFWNQVVKDIQKCAHGVFNADKHVSGPLKSFASKLNTVKHEEITPIYLFE